MCVCVGEWNFCDFDANFVAYQMMYIYMVYIWWNIVDNGGVDGRMLSKLLGWLSINSGNHGFLLSMRH